MSQESPIGIQETASSPRALHPLGPLQGVSKTDPKSFRVHTDILGFSPTGVEWFLVRRIINDNDSLVYWLGFVGGCFHSEVNLYRA